MRSLFFWSCLLLLFYQQIEADEGLGTDFNQRQKPKTIGGEEEEFEDVEGLEDEVDDESVVEESAGDQPPEPLDYETPMPEGFFYFADPFLDQNGIGRRWHLSTARKDGVDEDIAKYNGEWEIGVPSSIALKNDYGLIVKTKARHHAIAAKLDHPVTFDGKPFVIQYEVKYEERQECGGGYVKLLSKGAEKDLKNFQDKTPYSIMFGPDKCGMSSKVHFIIRYENPKNQTIGEYHAKATTQSLEDYFTDKKSHLYTLIVRPDHSFAIKVDQKEITSGNLLKDTEPEMTPPKEIEDPDDIKPADWDDREKIIDPDAAKPDDWDEDAPKEIEDESAIKPEDWLEEEEEYLPDPTAEKPDDWDNDMDEEWEAPKIKNPKCEDVSGCGTWKPPMIANPSYKGKWKPPKIANPNFKGRWSAQLIPNPHYFDPEPYKMTPITAIGLELWTMSDSIVFDNFLLTDSEKTAEDFSQKTWLIKSTQENLVMKATGGKSGVFHSLLSAAEERPWLWVVYILTVLIPIILISVFCFGGSKDKSAEAKKFDLTEADVEEEIEDEETENSKSSSQSESRRTSPRKGKAALEEDEGPDEIAGDKESPGRRLRQRKQD